MKLRKKIKHAWEKNHLNMSEKNETKMIRKMGNGQSPTNGTGKAKAGPVFYTIHEKEIKMDSRHK